MHRGEVVSRLLVAGLAALLLVSCQDQSTNPYNNSPNPPPPKNNPTTVNMASMTFNPSSLTVAKGTTVTWKNNDNVVHTSTADGGDWDTGNIAAGSSKGVTFNTAGTYTYHCIYHESMGMTGTIIVQ